MSNKTNPAPGTASSFEFKVDLNVINHLGTGLYSSTPAALTELVSNAWDADAKNVHITVDDARNLIVIEDDGHGMDEKSISDKFLTVGYSRRSTASGTKSASGTRKVMGRKGIGKLSMFALSNFVRVTSKTSLSEIVCFEVDVPEMRKELQVNKKVELKSFKAKPLKADTGTRIELTDVLKTLNRTESYLRTRLARRFGILGAKHGFRLFLNNVEITEADRDIHDSVQFLWAFDQDTLDRVSALSPNIAQVDDDGTPPAKVSCSSLLPSALAFPDGTTGKVTGYIASVNKPSELGSKEDSANAISIFANGRVFSENILGDLNSAKIYQSYLTGEIHADFLDDDEIDRATASREAIKKDDPKYRALFSFILSTLKSIGDQWDDWRTQINPAGPTGGNAAVNEWLSGIGDPHHRKVASRIIASITNATISSDEDKNEKAKAILYRGAIIGFEKLILKNQVDRLSEITDVLGAEFAAIFASLNDVEEAAYADITKQRLEVIKNFEKIKNDKTALEKVAQKYLFKNLWLLDPSWDRITGSAKMEVDLTEHIKNVHPDSTGARLDISYRGTTGRHVVVELKRPRIDTLKYDELSSQVRKYRFAVNEFYGKTHPNAPIPALDIYILVGTAPVMDEADRLALSHQGSKIITYSELITNAHNAYQEYITAHSHVTRLEKVLSAI